MNDSKNVVLVCGSRDYAYWPAFPWALDVLKPTCIVQGGAAGADEMARLYAVDVGIECITYPADWAKHGKAAGPIRNQKMLDEAKPDCVVAFPGGRGTADMVHRAKEAGVHVIEIAQTTIDELKKQIDAIPPDDLGHHNDYGRGDKCTIYRA